MPRHRPTTQLPHGSRDDPGPTEDRHVLEAPTAPVNGHQAGQVSRLAAIHERAHPGRYAVRSAGRAYALRTLATALVPHPNGGGAGVAGMCISRSLCSLRRESRERVDLTAAGVMRSWPLPRLAGHPRGKAAGAGGVRRPSVGPPTATAARSSWAGRPPHASAEGPAPVPHRARPADDSRHCCCRDAGWGHSL